MGRVRNAGIFGMIFKFNGPPPPQRAICHDGTDMRWGSGSERGKGNSPLSSTSNTTTTPVMMQGEDMRDF